ncbi:hypothetical protein VroAM7_49070 (plasmid) [Vibrio rotiferianus]|uniref:Uncharacterized protein n=1 Tax=Vibrio rotiferianus TaxID=190895 RepID=A0A510IEM7_9VIBR|nr:hypothetical protein [Vibrio rotiferianus]BBL92254.1 hypothetical protein VroAM7_49070 [Vibrio rotiferianus]
MLSHINPKDNATALLLITGFYVFTAASLILITTLGIQVSVFVSLLPFAFIEVLHYRALWHNVNLYNIKAVGTLLVLSTIYAYLMLEYSVTKTSHLYVVYAFVVAGVLFGHMRFVLIRMKQIKETQK